MKIFDYIVCDDIRPEINNKFSLMGTYNEKIEFLVNKGGTLNFPIVHPLGFYIRVITDGLKDFSDVQVDFYTNGKHSNSAKVKVIKYEPGGGPLILPLLNRAFILDKGELRFVVSFFQGDKMVGKTEPSIPFHVYEKVQNN